MARQLTMNFYDALMLDTGVGMAAQVDFGLNYAGSIQHSAIQAAVRAGATVGELDDALGDGSKITALVKKYAPSFDVVFKTLYDSMKEDYEKDIKDLESKSVLTEDERLELGQLYKNVKELN